MPKRLAKGALRDRTPVWREPSPIGKGAGVRFLGGTVSAVLAGFALAAIALTVLTPTQNRPRLTNWSVFAFALASVCFLLGMEFAAVATRYFVTPVERLGWMPDATLDHAVLNEARLYQAMDRNLADSYTSRAGLLYNVGVLGLLMGLGLLTVPNQWDTPTVLVLVIVAGAFLLELWWVTQGLHRSNISWLLPRYQDIRQRVEQQLPELDEVAFDSVMKPE